MKYLKIYELYGIADDILVVVYDSDGKDHGDTQQKVYADR